MLLFEEASVEPVDNDAHSLASHLCEFLSSQMSVSQFLFNVSVLTLILLCSPVISPILPNSLYNAALRRSQATDLFRCSQCLRSI